jgi:hypothetical protein
VIEVILFFGLVTAIAGAMIAQSKNRSPLVGALVGFFFNLLGLLVLAVLSKREPYYDDDRY